MCGCSILKMTVVFMVNWRQTIQKFLKSYVLSLCQYFRRFIAVVANFSFSTSVIWSRNACYGTTAVTHTAVCFFHVCFWYDPLYDAEKPPFRGIVKPRGPLQLLVWGSEVGAFTGGLKQFSDRGTDIGCPVDWKFSAKIQPKSPVKSVLIS